MRVNTPGANRVVELDWSDSLEPGIVGLYRLGEQRIEIRAGMKRINTVVLHEIMHVLGAEHGEKGSGIMSKRVPGTAMVITSTDLESLCSVAVCTAFNPEG